MQKSHTIKIHLCHAITSGIQTIEKKTGETWETINLLGFFLLNDFFFFWLHRTCFFSSSSNAHGHTLWYYSKIQMIYERTFHVGYFCGFWFGSTNILVFAFGHIIPCGSWDCTISVLSRSVFGPGAHHWNSPLLAMDNGNIIHVSVELSVMQKCVAQLPTYTNIPWNNIIVGNIEMYLFKNHMSLGKIASSIFKYIILFYFIFFPFIVGPLTNIRALFSSLTVNRCLASFSFDFIASFSFSVHRLNVVSLSFLPRLTDWDQF